MLKRIFKHRCRKVLRPPQRSTFQSKPRLFFFLFLFSLLGAAVTSLLQHLFALVFAALSACSQHPQLSYDHASIMSRNSNPVEHTSFPGNGGEGSGWLRREGGGSIFCGVVRSRQSSESNEAAPQIRHIPMIRAQVKNDPGKRGGALIEEKKKKGFLFPSQNNRLLPTPLFQTLISVGMID